MDNADYGTPLSEIDAFIDLLDLGLNGEEKDAARVLFGVFYAGPEVWRLAAVTDLTTPVVRYYMDRLEQARLWRRLANGGWEFRYRWADDLQSEDPRQRATGRTGFYLQVAAATGMIEVSWDSDEPRFRLNPVWAPTSGGRRCPVCARVNGRSYMTCSPECAEAWPVLRIHISPEKSQKHRLACAKAVLGNPAASKPSVLLLAARVREGIAPPPNRRFVVPGSRAARLAEQFGIDLGYKAPARQPSEPCPVPNEDGSRCKRRIRGDRLSCHIHGPSLQRAIRIESMTLDIERELVGVLG